MIMPSNQHVCRELHTTMSPNQSARPIVAPNQPASDQEEFVGGLSEEDDSLDQEAAMLSPLKGSELRVEAAKVSYRGIFYR
jgi:hypothetical protein